VRASDLRLLALTAALLLGSLGDAWAQANDREQEQLRRLRLQVQQLQQAQTAAQEQAAVAQAALAKARAETQAARDAEAAQRGRGGSQARQIVALEEQLASARSERETLVEQRDRLAEELEQARSATVRQRQRWRATEAAQLEAESRLATMTQRADRSSTLASQCAADNAALVKLGDELVDRLLDTSLWQRVSASEPLLQRGRVQLENLGQTYRDRIAAAQRPGSTSNPTPTASAGTAAKP